MVNHQGFQEPTNYRYWIYLDLLETLNKMVVDLLPVWPCNDAFFKNRLNREERNLSILRLKYANERAARLQFAVPNVAC